MAACAPAPRQPADSFGSAASAAWQHRGAEQRKGRTWFLLPSPAHPPPSLPPLSQPSLALGPSKSQTGAGVELTTQADRPRPGNPLRGDRADKPCPDRS